MTKLRDRLKLEEGLRLHSYPDPLTHGAPYTIGYGHTGADVKPATVWTQAQADSALDADIAKARKAVFSALPWVIKLDNIRQDVLVDMAFNMGVQGLLGFTHTLAMIREGDYAGASRNMLRSKWADQTKSRAQRLARITASGIDE